MQVRTIQSPGSKNSRIPATVRIGVTGHRALPNEPHIRESVKGVLARLDGILHHTPHSFVVVSPLAESADRIVATEVLAWHIPEGADKPSLEVVLPLPKEDYLRDFAAQKSVDEFNALVATATSTRTLDPAATRTAAYEQVGRYVVDHCDVLIAIWDGKPAGGQGGTAEIVEYARKIGRSFFWINLENGKIKEERNADRILESLNYLDAYNGEELNDQKNGSAIEAQYRILEKPAKESGLGSDLLEPLRQHLLPQFVRADLLAQRYQYRYTRAGTSVYALAALAVATVTIQTLFFPQFFQLLWLEVAEIALILLLLWANHVGDWHRKWIDYRFLAERLRAALLLCVAGIECDLPKPPPHLRLSHRPDDWMIRAFAWIWKSRPQAQPSRGIPLESLKDFLLAAWVGDQCSFYVKTGERHGKRHWLLARTGEALFGLTLLAAGVHAAGLGDWFLPYPPLHPGVLPSAAIILPTIGAALGGIRVHREYLRNTERYSHMARHLSTLGEQIKQAVDLQALTNLLEKANEVMLLENQDWRVLILSQELHAP